MVNIDTMICLYVMKVGEKISTQNIIYQTPFTPKLEIDYDLVYDKNDFDNKEVIHIMPATYSNGIEGKFILSVFCESPIELKKI